MRISKKCTGYRDHVSLLFRDESSKVRERAHAEWSTKKVPCSATWRSTSDKLSSYKLPIFLDLIGSPDTIPPLSSLHTSFCESNRHIFKDKSLQCSVPLTTEEQGFHFFVHQYIFGHPDEPKNMEELSSYELIWDPVFRNACIAIGLASLSNLNGNTNMMMDARQRYGEALRKAKMLVQANNCANIDLTCRLGIMLAMFDVRSNLVT